MDAQLRSRVVLRVTSKAGADPPRATAPLSPPTTGISIGAGSPAAFYCNRDPQVDAAHGTLERTAGHGVWVFVDHSERGSTLNGRTRVHRDAVVVRSGDKLTLGDTEIEIAVVPAAPAEIGGRRVHTNANKERTSEAMKTGVNMTRRWSMPKQSVPPIDTSFSQSNPMNRPPAFKRATSASSTNVAAVTPQYINSPIPGSNWRRKRNSIATATIRTPLIVMDDNQQGGKAIPSPPIVGMGQPFGFARGRTLVSPASTATSSDTTSSTNLYSPSPDSDGDHQYFHPLHVPATSGQGKSPPSPLLSPPQASPIPLEYSSSPVASPSLRRIHNLRNDEAKQGKLHAPYDAMALGGGPPKSRREDLRIQVSKKMAAAVEEKRSKRGDEIEQQPRPRHSPVVNTLSRIQQRHLEFTPPSSPVPHRDIVNQQKSLLAILKSKSKEEQLLKQQQEEWMRQRSDGSGTRSDGHATPPLSPIKTPKSSRSTFSSDDSSGSDSPVTATDLHDLIPERLPELLRTNSTGQSWRQPSPRVTAAVLASRAAREKIARGHFRTQHIDEKLQDDDDMGDTLLMKSANADNDSELSCKLDEFTGMRHRTRSSSTSSSDSVSVSSSVTTEVTCHRRVTRSLSVASSIDSNSSNSSALSPARGSCSDGDLADAGFFVGYDDDTDEEDESTTFRYYGEDSVTRSRGDSAPLAGSATLKRSASYDSSSSSSHSSSPSQTSAASPGMFTTHALRSPRKLMDVDQRRPSHRGRNYLQSKRHQEEAHPEGMDDMPSLAPAKKPDLTKHSKDASTLNNNIQDSMKTASRSTRRRSAPPSTMTLGLPLSKLALSINATDLHSENQLEADPETGSAQPKRERVPPPPPPPSAGKPSRDARPSFRRRSAFALA